MNGHLKTSDPVKPSSVKSFVELDFVTFGRCTVSLPLVSLIVCFVSAVLFQYDQVNKTDTCVHVPNMIPSISAITGVTPQRYIWRMCIALHCTPRFVIGFIYWSYYCKRELYVSSQRVCLYRYLIKLIFYIYMIENACLCGVTFIANVENYPLHEKIFIVFMITSIAHQLLTLIVFCWAHPDWNSMPLIKRSLQHKFGCFVGISVCTCGLLYFYFRHRWYCESGAFTMFSTFEYGIAVCNILFHWTAVYEFKDLKWTVALNSLRSVSVDEEQDDTHSAQSSNKQIKLH